MDIATDPHAHLRAAFSAGCRIQAWHLNGGATNSNDGRWDTLMPPEGREPEFGCAPHLYRVHPEDKSRALCLGDDRTPTTFVMVPCSQLQSWHDALDGYSACDVPDTVLARQQIAELLTASQL